MKSLYEISIEATSIMDEITETGELTPALEIYLTSNQVEFQNKLPNIINRLKIDDMEIEQAKKEIERYSDFIKRKTKAKEITRQFLVNIMNTYGVEKIATPAYSLSIRRSESVEVYDNLDSEYMVEKVTYAPDKIRIKNAIKAGDTVEGARLVENYSLQIK